MSSEYTQSCVCTGYYVKYPDQSEAAWISKDELYFSFIPIKRRVSWHGYQFKIFFSDF